MTAEMTMTRFFSIRWATGVVVLGLLGACATKQPKVVSAAPAAPLTAPYQGVFISACSELTPGLYYADALKLKPKDARFVSAAYTKVFFLSPNCEASSRLIKFDMPEGSWEVIGQTLIDGKHIDQVIVNLVVGQLKGEIYNPAQVKETADSYVITFGENNKHSLPLQKETGASVDKELRLIENGRLHMSDAGAPPSPDGFPTFLLPPEDAFVKQ
jgi:hypothetical protein